MNSLHVEICRITHVPDCLAFPKMFNVYAAHRGFERICRKTLIGSAEPQEAFGHPFLTPFILVPFSVN